MSQFYSLEEAGDQTYEALHYWHKYGEYFHGDFNDRDTIAIDEGCPERAIKSFWAWFEQKDI